MENNENNTDNFVEDIAHVIESTTNDQEDDSGLVQLIVFSVGSEDYGLEIEKIEAVIRMKTIKKLPKAPNFILGIMNLRGKIIPIVGLREKFGMEPIEYNKFTRIIVVNHRNKLVGMVVDEVNKVIDISASNMEGNPDMVSDSTKSLVRGVAKLEEQVIILVELDYLLFSSEEFTASEEQQDTPEESQKEEVNQK